jgi:hypothetical protein
MLPRRRFSSPPLNTLSQAQENKGLQWNETLHFPVRADGVNLLGEDINVIRKTKRFVNC